MKKLLPIVGFLAVLFVGIVVVYQMFLDQPVLKIYQPTDINPQLVDEEVRKVGKYHRIADFELTDQQGNKVTNADFAGKIYVADFFFTTCPSICPKMTKNMSLIADELVGNDMIRFLSHSVTPDVDSVPVLAAYAAEKGVNYDQWKLVTGSKVQIYELARKSYFAATTEGDGGPNDFIHTENFVLIDPDKRIRGFYDGTSAEEMERLRRDIDVLLKEYQKDA
jgi:protein SCO1